MKIEQLKPGMVVYDCHSHRMGNTTLRSLGTWSVRIISVDPEGRFVEASWNGNPAQKFYRNWRKWKINKPHLVRNSLGQYRRETREERKIRLSTDATRKDE